MSKKLKFVWIDDDGRREAGLENLKKELNVSGKFIDVSKQSDTFDKFMEGDEPDIILQDHNLIRIYVEQSRKNSTPKKGSTLAAFIKERWPMCPIVCITAAADQLDTQQRSLYEAVYSYTSISNHYESMLSIAKSFRALRTTKPKSLAEVIAMLKAPDEDLERLQTIAPNKLKVALDDPAITVSISGWVRNVLMERPGFLYDRLWASTLLGIKESSFKKIEPLLTTAKYKGVFSDTSKERWWKSKLLIILSSKVGGPGLSWVRGRKLSKKLHKKDFSECYSSNEEFPETVAFTDETNSKAVPIKLKHTIPHPSFEDMLYFEEIRLMKAAE